MSRMKVIENEYTYSTALNFESMFTQGNGYIHTRGTLEEKFHIAQTTPDYLRKPINVTAEEFPETDSQVGTFIPVIVGPHPLLNTVSINIPGFWGFQIIWNDVVLVPGKDVMLAHERVLHFDSGELVRKTRWITADSAEIEVVYRRFLSKVEKHLGMLTVEIEVLKGQGTLGIAGGINAGFRTNGFNHFTSVQCGEVEDLIYIDVQTNGGDRVAVSSALKAIGGSFPLARTIQDSEVLFYGEQEVEKGYSIAFEKSCVFSTSQDVSDYSADPFRALHRRIHYRTQEKGYQVSLEDSASIWKTEWEQAVCCITGDNKIQDVLDFSIYHLLRSQEKRNDRITICPKGFAGEAYFGRFFWDTEAYLLSFFIYTDPDRARDLVMFRYNTLEGAKRNAVRYGYTGAKYAWESSLSGDEECPNWQYADHEIHVTADVSYGVWHYISAVEDIDFLESYGFEILWETAKFWESRIDRFEDGTMGYAGVMGPDEYSPFSTNNAFTNEMARFNLTVVGEAWRMLQKKRSASIAGLKKRLGVTAAQLKQMKVLANEIVQPQVVDDIILQCKEFNGYVPIDMQTLRSDENVSVGSILSQERLYRSKLLKQADVLAYMTLFPEKFTALEFNKNLEFYEPYTTHDSSLSYSIHALAASYAGSLDTAVNYFNKSLYLDYNITSKRVERGIHIANAAGIWQILVFGFCGIRTNGWNRNLIMDPSIPENLGTVEIRFVWKRNIYNFTITNDKVVVRSVYTSNLSNCSLQVFNKSWELPDTGETRIFQKVAK
jgi:trehalose/maltose hydrolase-like predicted phosphorylase